MTIGHDGMCVCVAIIARLDTTTSFIYNINDKELSIQSWTLEDILKATQ